MLHVIECGMKHQRTQNIQEESENEESNRATYKIMVLVNVNFVAKLEEIF
jgi:hypothetical protein